MAIDKVKFPNGNTENIQDSRIPGVDSTPTANSANLVTSGGIKSALDKYVSKFTNVADYSVWNSDEEFGFSQWTTNSQGAPSPYGTSLNFRDSTTWYYRLMFETGGRIHLYSGINTTNLTSKGALAFLSDLSDYLPLTGGTLNRPVAPTLPLVLYNPDATGDSFIGFRSGSELIKFGLRSAYSSYGLTIVDPSNNYYKVWHAGNDGTGSGLDADLLDGLQPSQLDVNTAKTLKGYDNRDVNNPPSWYMSNPGQVSIFTEFAQAGGAVSLPNYESRTTFTPWADASGGRPTQLSLSDSGAFFRTSASDSAWNNWREFAFKDDLSGYLPLTGGTLTGLLRISSGNDAKIILDNTDNETNYQQIVFSQNGTEYARLGTFSDTILRWQIGEASYKIWHEGNDGSGSGLDADLLDGLDSASYLHKLSQNIDANSNSYGVWSAVNAPSSVHYPGSWGTLLAIQGDYTNYKGQLFIRPDTAQLSVRGGSGDDWWDWKTVAFTDSNVASATKLQTARSIWGQNFDGSGNVNGKFFFDGGDATLKIFSAAGIFPNYGDETVVFQSAIDRQDPETSTLPAQIPERSVISFQPRGGRVGVGTTSPDAELDVNGSAAFGSSGSCDVYLRRAGLNYIRADAASNGAIQFTANSNNVMMVHSRGVSIGHQYEHDYALEVAGDTKSDSLTTTLQTSEPSGGMLPNREYKLGTLSSATTFTLAAETSGVTNHYFWTFETGSTAPTITWPAAITSWAGGSAPSINSNRHYEVSVLNGVAVVLEV